MIYHFVTSMSQAIYDATGKTFIDSFSEHSPFPLVVYSEDPLEDERYPLISLTDDQDLMDFLAICPYPESKHYQWQAGRFAKKVFAVTGRIPESGWWIWLDADVIIDKPLTEEFLRSVCPDDCMGSYLGRKDWHHSEAGWVAYNLPRANHFLEEFRKMYVSGEIFDHLEWTDPYLFDRLRERINGTWLNISSDVPGMHVWDGSPLGKVSRHLKGPLRKKGSKAAVPDEYWSEKEHEEQKTGAV